MKIVKRTTASVSMVLLLDEVESFELLDIRTKTVIKLAVEPSPYLDNFVAGTFKDDVATETRFMNEGLYGIMYEATVYDRIGSNPTEYILRPHSTAKTNWNDLLEKIPAEDREFFHSAVFLYLKNMSNKKIDYSDKARLIEEYIANKDDVDDLLQKLLFTVIILPHITGQTFGDLIYYDGYWDRFIPSFLKIMKGIKSLYRLGIAHNDLHSSNIFIERELDGNENRKVWIYDFDRSYIDGIPNLNLNNDPMDGLCQLQSQCNILTKTHITDFFKILSHTAFSTRFQEFFGIIAPPEMFRVLGGRYVFYFNSEYGEVIDVQDLLQEMCETHFSFFNDRTRPPNIPPASYLQYYENYPVFQQFVGLMCPLNPVPLVSLDHIVQRLDTYIKENIKFEFGSERKEVDDEPLYKFLQ